VVGISPVEALSFTVVLMVASIPMAIEIVTTTTLALGSKELSKHGAIGKYICSVSVLYNVLFDMM
jgi:magnesium-transporting ATPase (P-type)